MKITVFTATYNRACLIERVWKSLVEQNFNAMEWVVVDDGSTDDTQKVVERLQKESDFDVIYSRQERGGKHRAINRGVKIARGELFFIVDSDDWLADGALEKVWNKWINIEYKKSFAGVCGIDVTPEGTVIGSGLGADMIDGDSVEIRKKYHVDGDLKEVFRTEVLREFPFPEIETERFCPEQLVWFRIAQKYKMRFFNEGIYVAEYQDEGLTDRIVRARRESPVASMITYSEATRYDIGLLGKVRSAINFWRFWKPNKGVKIETKWLWCAPLGWMMSMMDSLRN